MSLNNNVLATVLGTTGSMKKNIPAAAAAVITPARRSANYHPSVWGDKFLAYTSNGSRDSDTDTVKRHEQMKEDIKMMLVKKTGEEEAKQLMILIDNLQRLGISYHFEAEIDVALQQISQNYHYIYNDSAENFDDLHDIALCFRLLRQNGYKVSTDVFCKYMDSYGELKPCLIEDRRGMLSLYEAAHFRVHEEEILEEAVSFTTLHLSDHMKKNQQDIYNPNLANQICHALKYPIRKNLNRVGARHYISYTDQLMIDNIDHIDSHSKLLVDFAKLDFNLLQTMYQQELGHIARWWKDLNFCEKLPFARDRVVECYFWILGVYFEPKYNMARRFLTKVIMLASVVDDIYDLYATYEELLLFTDAIEKWDTSCLNMLPEYMQVCYQALLDTYSEMEKVLDKEAGRPTYRVSEAKNSFKRLAKAYLDEAKWYKEGYFPTTVEEYMKVGLVSSGYGTMATHCFVGMGDEATREVFHWVSNDPLIVRASCLIARLCDDMTGHEFEQEKGDIPSAVECYMKQHCATKEEAIAELQKKVVDAWKDINQECYYLSCVPAPNNNNITIPLSLLARIDNLTRAIHVLYDGDDGYTHSSTRTKDLITSVLIDPLPL